MHDSAFTRRLIGSIHCFVVGIWLCECRMISLYTGLMPPSSRPPPLQLYTKRSLCCKQTLENPHSTSTTLIEIQLQTQHTPLQAHSLLPLVRLFAIFNKDNAAGTMSSGRGFHVLSWNKAEMTYNASGTPTVAKQYRSHPKSRAMQTVPRLDLLDDPTEPFAVDLEFQQSKREGDLKGKQRIGRVSVVNTRGDVVYDVYTAYDNEPDVKKSVPAATI